MSDHFAAFSFVDRITNVVPGQSAQGEFGVPMHLATFPACLVAESVGQLAAWVAMAHIDWRGRPVAALAFETRFLRPVRGGDRLDLAVTIDSVDDEAVAYHGHAEVAGTRVIELVDCLGPMLPVADFDAPEVMARRYALLCGEGASAGRFGGVSLPLPAAVVDATAVRASAQFTVPVAAPFFNDHFPRRPVFPATLLLNALIDVARQLAASWGAASATPLRMTRVKVRAFTPPGQSLELVAETRSREADSASIALSARAEGKVVATAQVDLDLIGVVA